MTSYIGEADLKRVLNIEPDDPREDTLVALAVAAASQAVDQVCRRTFDKASAASARQFVAPYRSSVLMVDDIADITGLTTSLNGTAFTGFTAYPLNAAAVGEPVTWLEAGSMGCWDQGPVTVTAVWGWPAVPAPVQQATLRLAMRYFRGKDAPDGASGWVEQGPTTAFLAGDPIVSELLAPFVLRSVS